MPRGKDLIPREPYGPRPKTHKLSCLACGLAFKAGRPDAQTCSRRCRNALATYRRKNGGPPLFPFFAPGAAKLSAAAPAPAPRAAAKPTAKGKGDAK